MLLIGIFGIISQTLKQLVAQIQEDEDNYSDNNNANSRYNPYRPVTRIKKSLEDTQQNHQI